MDRKSIRKVLNRIVAIIFIAAIFAGIWRLLRYMLVDDTRSYTRVTMHEYYNQENIDVLFSGASLCYRSFDTRVMDQRLGVNTFNLGSSDQDMDASCYLIKDAVNRYDIDHIYLELSLIMALNIDIENRDIHKMTGTYIVSDYMKPSVSKVQYLLGASKSDYYINSFLPARRNWENLFNPGYIAGLLEAKSSSVYKNYEYDNLIFDTEYYDGKGYVANNVQIPEHSFCDFYGFYPVGINDINANWYKYVYKIIQYCRKKGVELTFVCAPLSEYFLVGYGNYDEYHELVAEIAVKEGVEFWDFNLCKEEYFPVRTDYYMDSAHLNMYGAKVFSELFADLISGKVDYADICYSSVSEKLDNLEPMVNGLAYDSTSKKIIANHEKMFEYRITVIPDEGESYLIQDFDANNTFDVNAGESGRIYIEAKRIDAPSNITEVVFSY